MKKIPIITALACGILISACNPSSSSGAVDNSGSDSSDSSDASSDGATRLLISGNLALPEQMALVSASDTTRSATRAPTTTRALIDSALVEAFADDSDYNTELQNAYIYLDASEPITFIDSLLCYNGQSRLLSMNGEGNYVAWSEAACFEARRGGNQDQGDADEAPSYIPMIANATQTAEDSPLLVSGWIPEFPQQSTKIAVKVMTEITETPTDETPYGIFKMTYGLLPTITSLESEKIGEGELTSSRTADGSSSFTLYQNEANGGQDDQGNYIEFDCTTVASVNYNEDTETGRARTSKQCLSPAGDIEPSRSRAFAMTTNADYIRVQDTDTVEELTNPTPNTVLGESCLQRNEMTDTAWNYGLYHIADGSEVILKSGVQLHVDTNNDGTFESWGHMGYFGSWRQDNGTWTNGEKVQQATQDGSTGKTYTVKVAPGKLVKNTREAVPLTEVHNAEFTAHNLSENDARLTANIQLNGDSGDTDFDDRFDVILMANTDNNGLDITATLNYSSDGEAEITPLQSPVALSLATGEVLHLWSRQLGGNIDYAQGSDSVSSFVRSYVNGSEIATGELFDGSIDATLHCVERCLKAGITGDDISVNSLEADVYATGADAPSDYTFAKNDLTLVNSAGNAAGFINTVTDLSSSEFWSNGLQTGPMVTAADKARFNISDADSYYTALSNGLETFYQWETGVNPWQKQIVLIDDTDNSIVKFDRPIGIQYTHSTVNDRNADNTKDGEVFMLEYRGRGKLNGLPWEQKEGSNNWTPVISLADGVVVKDRAEKEYVLKALEVEQQMTAVDASFCQDMTFDAPTQPIPTGITQDVFNISAMPDMTDRSPSVIGGVVQGQ